MFTEFVLFRRQELQYNASVRLAQSLNFPLKQIEVCGETGWKSSKGRNAIASFKQHTSINFQKEEMFKCGRRIQTLNPAEGSSGGLFSPKNKERNWRKPFGGKSTSAKWTGTNWQLILA